MLKKITAVAVAFVEKDAVVSRLRLFDPSLVRKETGSRRYCTNNISVGISFCLVIIILKKNKNVIIIIIILCIMT